LAGGATFVFGVPVPGLAGCGGPDIGFIAGETGFAAPVLCL
jgi:hypothetical protein